MPLLNQFKLRKVLSNFRHVRGAASSLKSIFILEHRTHLFGVLIKFTLPFLESERRGILVQDALTLIEDVWRTKDFNGKQGV